MRPYCKRKLNRERALKRNRKRERQWQRQRRGDGNANANATAHTPTRQRTNALMRQSATAPTHQRHCTAALVHFGAYVLMRNCAAEELRLRVRSRYAMLHYVPYSTLPYLTLPYLTVAFALGLNHDLGHDLVKVLGIGKVGTVFCRRGRLLLVLLRLARGRPPLAHDVNRVRPLQ